MNGASTDYIQATIEIFGFIITLLVAMVFWIITGNKKKSQKSLFLVLVMAGLSLLFDAGWYIYDGNTSQSAFILNYLANFMIFLCNPITLLFFINYLRSLVIESEHKPNKVLSTLVLIVGLTAFLIPFSNLFIKWMYHIDANNVYCRMSGWYVYTAANCLGLILCMIMVAVHRKHISKTRRIAIYIFLLAPFIGIMLQSTNIGISFIQLGSVIGTLGIVASYLFDWIRRENKENDISEDRKRLWLIECAFAIMILFVSAAIISCVVSVSKVSSKNSEQSSTSLAFMVSETVDGVLSEPINVSRTMAQSHIVQEALSEETLEGSQSEAEMLAFMKRIKEEYGYQAIFVASDRTKAYYTSDGLSRYMQVDTDIKDAWYNEFKSRGIKYELNIDADKDNAMTLAVFINMEVRNDDGELLGVCGVAMSVESMMDILSQYEDEYSLDIILTDRDAIIQVDTERKNIGERLSYDINVNTDSDIVYYEKNNVKARLIKYMNGLDWYLVIDDNNPNKLNIIEVILPSMIIYILGVVIMIAVSCILSRHEKKTSHQLRVSRRISETDGLTGLRNRYSLNKYMESKENEELSESLTVLMIDINGLKFVNDNQGHDAGDELIQGASRCMNFTFGDYGEIYRIGGDEFIIISECGESKIKALEKKFQELVKTWKGKLVDELTLSVGKATHKEHPDSTLAELIKIADDDMYKRKNEYYEETGKERRRR